MGSIKLPAHRSEEGVTSKNHLNPSLQAQNAIEFSGETSSDGNITGFIDHE